MGSRPWRSPRGGDGRHRSGPRCGRGPGGDVVSGGRAFVIAMPRQDLDGSRVRLRRSRLYGPDLEWPAGKLRELVDCSADKSAWRTVERRLNRLSRFQADVATEGGALRLPFLPARGNGRSPRPLVFGRGRPGLLWGDRHDPRPGPRTRRPRSPSVAAGGSFVAAAPTRAHHGTDEGVAAFHLDFFRGRPT
ncbi:epoxide hydrolase N-terminal domain-containing protein [Streptomyces sp. NPDC005760]|uniref:epoxide hydrolase N-terminal domain-containing protein n=1 Tax=Streptomyces sp. NPDC005760 TaxID=3156718 RepID=UPI0033F91BFF